MKALLLTFVLFTSLLPFDASANILKDYVGRWKYVEKTEGSSAEDKFTLSVTARISKTRDGGYRTIATQKVGSKERKAFEEYLKPNKSAVLETFDTETGKSLDRYTGKWFVRSGRLHYDYVSKPDSSGKTYKLKGSLKRDSANNWTGSSTFTGGYKSTVSMTRLR